MGLLDGATQQQYYTGNDLGNYQFTSLEDVINQFLVAYVGEEKIISKVSRTDVAFHAQRAMQELSFDTFKSIKSQEIELPPSNTMILPHDYVNYTRVMWSDGSGIKHPLYPTRDTQNPFSIKQNSGGDYSFGDIERLVNGAFDQPLAVGWTSSQAEASGAWDSTTVVPKNGYSKYFFNYIDDKIELTAGILEFSQLWHSYNGNYISKSYGSWQRVDVSGSDTISLTADGTSGSQILDGSTVLCDYGVLRIGITTTDPSVGWDHSYLSVFANASGLPNNMVNNVATPISAFDPLHPKTSTYTAGSPVPVNYTDPSVFNPKNVADMVNVLLPATYVNSNHAKFPSPNFDADKLDLGYVEWIDGTTGEKELEEVDVSSYDEVWIWVQSYSPWTVNGITLTSPLVTSQGGTTAINPTSSVNNTHQINSIDNVSLKAVLPNLANANDDGNSTTWTNYKSGTPSENQNSYDDGTYDLIIGERYGLDPQHAQVNGSFYIDNLRGLINFSSNVSGKTVILDYISDSLGTDGEMQVHKFAEEAMYKWIMCAVLSTKANIPEYVVRRYQKEKFAATRTAKLRLSNIKLEELTQILRGKSKWIKH
jgi:hypothetical protein